MYKLKELNELRETISSNVLNDESKAPGDKLFSYMMITMGLCQLLDQVYEETTDPEIKKKIKEGVGLNG